MDDYRVKAFREDNDTVFSSKDHSSPIAFVGEKTWFDRKIHQPVAYEEVDLACDWHTHKPVLVISRK